MKKIIILVLIALIGLTACANQPNYDEFAKCLTANGMSFYGAFWCPHCQVMKEKFGDSFKYVHYVECDERGANPQPEVCKQEIITGYPTFVFENKNRLEGEQDLSALGLEAGCVLP